MSTKNNSSRNSEIDFYLDAEIYDILAAHKRFKLHPEGLPRITRNCMIIGPLGIGKTIVLKELCYKYKNDNNIFPVYIYIVKCSFMW